MKLRSNLTKEEIKNIEDVINYTFNNKEILQTAFTRKTFAAENQVMSNEMYEYVGDTVIDFVINKYNVMQRIYYIDNKPVELHFEKGSTEDQLTQLKQKIVNVYSLNRKYLEQFNSPVDAAILMFNDKNKIYGISKCLNGDTKTAYGYIWEYADEGVSI